MTRTQRIAWIGTILVLGGVSVGLVWFLPKPLEASGDCPVAEDVAPQPKLSPGIAPIPLSLPENDSLTVNFWRNRGFGKDDLILRPVKKTLSGKKKFARLDPSLVIRVNQSSLNREGLDGRIEADQYTVNAEVTSFRELQVALCLAPDVTDSIDPGRYTGTIEIRNPAIESINIPVVVTFQYPDYRWIAVLAGSVTFIGGSFSVWAAGRKAARKPIWTSEALGRLLPRWLLENYAGVVAGTIAAVSVFVAQYLRNPAWGAKAPEDWFALFGSVFTAYTATLTTISTAGPLPDPSSRDAAKDSPDLPPGSAEGDQIAAADTPLK